MTVYILKDPFGLKFKKDLNSCGWRYFPAEVKDVKGITQYFCEGKDTPIRRQYNPPDIQFVDAKGKPTSYYSVSPDKGRVIVNFDPKKELLLHPDKFLTLIEQLDFLRPRCSIKTEDEVLQIDELEDKVKHLLKNARKTTLTEFNKYVNSESKTPEAVMNFCSVHSKANFKCPAIVEFSDKAE